MAPKATRSISAASVSHATPANDTNLTFSGSRVRHARDSQKISSPITRLNKMTCAKTARLQAIRSTRAMGGKGVPAVQKRKYAAAGYTIATTSALKNNRAMPRRGEAAAAQFRLPQLARQSRIQIHNMGKIVASASTKLCESFFRWVY